MSSMRNAIQRRSHRERGQLKEREKLGLLEKHKDYTLRAKDHKKKQTVLKSLKQKAAERNEDEFYFGMVSRSGKFSASRVTGGKKWTGTVAGDRGNEAMDVDTVRLLKTQDIGYVRTMRNVVAKQVRELEQKAAVTGAFAGVNAAGQEDDDEEDDSFDDSDEDDAPRRSKSKMTKPRKIVFADSVEEVEKMLPPPSHQKDDDEMDTEDDEDDFEKFDDDDDDDNNNNKKKQDREALKRRQNAERLQRKLRSARKKLKALANAENALELQRARMAKTATVGGITKNGKKLKVRERKR